MTAPVLRYSSWMRRRPPAEQLLAQEGVEVDAAQAPLLVARRRRPAGLVVGDDELAVGVQLEPVDDAAQVQAADLDLEPQLEADGVDRGRVLQVEVLLDQRLGVGEERRPRPRRRARAGRVGVGGAAPSTAWSRRGTAGSGCGRPARGANSSSRARCTSVPLVGGDAGGSGSWSMAENRNARGQLVNASTREGDRLVGTGNAMPRCVRRGVRQFGAIRLSSTVRSRRNSSTWRAIRAGSLERPEVARCRRCSGRAVGDGLGHPLGRSSTAGRLRCAAEHEHRAASPRPGG